MGWNDHLDAPDAWEDHVEALADKADDERKRVWGMSRSSWYCPLCKPNEPCDKHART